MPKTSNTKIHTANFEDILDKAIAVHYSEHTIEIPGIVIFKKEGSSQLLSRVLNPSLNIVEISEEDFNSMLHVLDISELEGKLYFKTETSPEKNVVLNLDRLKESAVYSEQLDDTVMINNFMFTSNKLEFHAAGMLSFKHVYYMEDLSVLRDIAEAI